MAGFIDQINALRDTSSREEKVAAIQEALDISSFRNASLSYIV